MNQVLLALQAGVQVLFAALLLGAGLPAIFALGMKGLAYGQGGTAEVEVGPARTPSARRSPPYASASSSSRSD